MILIQQLLLINFYSNPTDKNLTGSWNPGSYTRAITVQVTAPFNNMRTLKFKAQPTNAFFATVNQMFADSSQLSTASERAVIKSLCTAQTTNRVRQ